MTQIKTVLITERAKLIKAIDSIQTRGKRLDNDIQVAGLSVLSAMSKDNDSTLADRLVHAMPRGDSTKALTGWLLAYGNVRLLDKADPAEAEAIKQHKRIFAYDKSRTVNLADAEAKPWHTFKKDTTPQDALDVQAAVHSLINRVKNATTKGMTVKGRNEALAQLDELRAALTAQHVSETLPEATM